VEPVVPERVAPVWRAVISWLFLVLFFLTMPIALLTGWARLVAIDSTAFGRTMADMAADGRVQSAVGRVVAARVATTVSGENPTATEALQSRVVGEVVREAMSGVVESAEFRDIWEATTGGGHQLLVGQIGENLGEPVTLDFTPLDDNIQAEIAALDLELPPDFAFDTENLRIQVFDAPTADRIRLAAQRVEFVFMVTLALAIVSLILSLAFAPNRLAALMRASFGLTLAMVALIALMLTVQGWVMGETGPEGGAAVAGVILDALSQGLRVAAVGLAVLGLLLAGALTGLRGLTVGTPRRTPAGMDA
jgi:hypothetical protein